MAHPTGESVDGSLRLDFDRRIKLEFHGLRITSDAGGRRTEDAVRRDPAADRRPAAAVATASGMSIWSNDRSQSDGRSASMIDRDRPNAAKKVVSKPHDPAPCDGKCPFERLDACQERRNGRLSALGNWSSGESRFKASASCTTGLRSSGDGQVREHPSELRIDGRPANVDPNISRDGAPLVFTPRM